MPISIPAVATQILSVKPVRYFIAAYLVLIIVVMALIFYSPKTLGLEVPEGKKALGVVGEVLQYATMGFLAAMVYGLVKAQSNTPVQNMAAQSALAREELSAPVATSQGY